MGDPLTVVNYTLFGCASGFMLATVFAARQVSVQTGFFGGWAIVLTVIVFITRSISLYRNERIRPKSTIQTAIGIRHTQIQQKAQGAMAGSFNTREYFHGASKRKYKNIKWAFLVLVFPVPLLLVSAGLATGSSGFLPGRFPGAVHRFVHGALVFLRTGKPSAESVLSNGLSTARRHAGRAVRK